MQNIIIDKPYRFIPPVHRDFWPSLFKAYLPAYLRRTFGIESWELLGVDRLKASIQAGHGILLTPNHCRPSDPMAIGLLVRETARPVYIMASWHLFMQNRFQTWLLPRIGVFSVYREGLDRESLKCAVRILADARRPLVLFPEGIITRSNDRLLNLMEGTAFLARQAAKQRAALDPPGKVVVHPVALRYVFRGNLEQSLAPVLEDIEKRLSWSPRTGRPLLDRILKAGHALLTLKEIEILGAPQTGDLPRRLNGLIDALLVPLEQEWLKGKRDGDVVARVKTLRAAILPDMVSGDITEEERARRWKQLADTYVAQQLFLYPPEYFGDHPTPEQMLETVERYEEDLTDHVRVHRPIHVVIEVCDAIEVSPARDRGAETDPLMVQVRQVLETKLAQSKEQVRRAPDR